MAQPTSVVIKTNNNVNNPKATIVLTIAKLVARNVKDITIVIETINHAKNISSLIFLQPIPDYNLLQKAQTQYSREDYI